MAVTRRRLGIAAVAAIAGTNAVAVIIGATAVVGVCATAVSAQPVTAPTAPTAAAQSAAVPAALADSVVEARTTAIASQLRCPVCQGLSIQDSPSDLSQQMRSVVQAQIVAGKTDDEIRAYFVSKYGEWILLSPAPHGVNLVAYALPVALLLGGAVIIVLGVRRWVGPVGPDGGDAATAGHAGGHAGENEHTDSDRQ